MGHAEKAVGIFNATVLNVSGAATFSAAASFDGAVDFTSTVDLTNATVTASGMTYTRTGQVYHFPANAGKVGATSGMTTNNDTGAVLCPASQTAATFTIPLQLKQGAVITAFAVSGQIESAGNTVTVDADLRATTAVASDLTDASVGAITQISKTADYLINDSKTSLSHTVISGNSYYVLITITTAASTDVALQGVEVTVTEK